MTFYMQIELQIMNSFEEIPYCENQRCEHRGKFVSVYFVLWR
jgi:hypothetical protein